MRSWSISAPSMPSAARAIDVALGAVGAARMPWVLDPVFIERSPARAQFARELLARGPAVVRLNAAEFAALFGGDPAARRRARRRGLRHRRGADRRHRHRHRRRAPRRNRQRRSADGSGHRHGLRRLGAGLRGAGGRNRRLARDRRGADRSRRRRRSRGARPRAGPAASPARSSMPCTVSTAPRCARARHAKVVDL